MNVLFGSETVNCRHITVMASNAQIGDLLKLGDRMFRVETVQKACPSIDNLKHLFINWILRDELGNMLTTRSIYGTINIYRPTQRKVS